MEIDLPDEQATELLGARLARGLPRTHLLLYIRGALGAGKTTLVRGMLHALGYAGAVKSPTFPLVESYEFAGWSLFHFDLYRINDPEELEFLGLRDYLTDANVCVIEWPERAGGILPEPDVDVTMRASHDGRHATLIAHSTAGAMLLHEFR